jgi:hypothetical protein
MRRHALLACLSAALLLLSGCERRVTGIVISKESASWRGIEGTAVTIRLDREIKNLQGGDTAGFIFHGGLSLGISDYTKPVLKVEGQTVTLFFGNNETDNLVVSELPQYLHDGSVDIVRCDPDRVCP